ncbi:hypothetical protein [Sphingopyxis kveilinensis]|uniref:hypothetical protein n=1 Tax=Sphingopyxis kveilinensis TaxID=3114367 RepID=UPI0030CE6327
MTGPYNPPHAKSIAAATGGDGAGTVAKATKDTDVRIKSVSFVGGAAVVRSLPSAAMLDGFAIANPSKGQERSALRAGDLPLSPDRLRSIIVHILTRRSDGVNRHFERAETKGWHSQTM